MVEKVENDIFAHSKHIYWFEKPVSITDDTKIELLKRDMLVHEYKVLSLNNLDLQSFISGEDRFCIYFFNLDGICTVENAKSNEAIMMVSKRLSTMINNFVPQRCIVHSNIINQDIKSLFNNDRIIFIQKNLFDPKVAIKTILNLVPILIGDQGREKRSFLRLEAPTDSPIKFQISLLKPTLSDDGSKILNTLQGVIIDISLNGFGLRITNGDLSSYALKTPVTLKVILPRVLLKIDLAFVVRNKPEENELAVHFDLNNHRMISEDNATTLSTFIFQNIRSILKSSEYTLDQAVG